MFTVIPTIHHEILLVSLRQEHRAPPPQTWKWGRDGFINWAILLTLRGQMLQFIHLFFQHTHTCQNTGPWMRAFDLPSLVMWLLRKTTVRCRCLWLLSRWSAFRNPSTPVPFSTWDALSNCWGLVHVMECPSFALYTEPVLYFVVEVPVNRNQMKYLLNKILSLVMRRRMFMFWSRKEYSCLLEKLTQSTYASYLYKYNRNGAICYQNSACAWLLLHSGVTHIF